MYLDDSALEYPKQEVIDAVVDVLNNNWCNPNSVYEKGIESKRLVLNAKDIIAKEINCNSDDLIICSGGSEANTLGLIGYIKANDKFHFITSAIEHSSIVNNPYAALIIGVDRDGKYNMGDISEIHDKLVCLSYVNSEIGTIQDIKDIIKILHSNNCIVHVDAVAALGKVKIDVKDIDADMLVITSQKIGGVLGSAVLYKKPEIKIQPYIYGHDTYRAGTPNVASIVGFGKAIELINYNNIDVVKNKRDYLLRKILRDNITLNGSLDNRVCNNINICINDIRLTSQQIVVILDLCGHQVSSGSACNSGINEPSKVLKAIGLSDNEANHSIRITLPMDCTYEELDVFVNDFNRMINQYKIK